MTKKILRKLLLFSLTPFIALFLGVFIWVLLMGTVLGFRMDKLLHIIWRLVRLAKDSGMIQI